MHSDAVANVIISAPLGHKVHIVSHANHHEEGIPASCKQSDEVEAIDGPSANSRIHWNASSFLVYSDSFRQRSVFNFAARATLEKCWRTSSL